MSFDGLFTYCMTHELNELLSGGRIYKIHQPFENEIVMTVRSRGKNHKLLLSAHPKKLMKIRVNRPCFVWSSANI